jgi:quinol monooxygenase YgiN
VKENKMIITQLEGRIAPEQWEAMKQTYHDSIQKLPSVIYETYLMQDGTDREIWRIITVWRSREALQEYRASVATPEGILMFRAVGTEPTMSFFEVVDHAGGN